jgi:hypothetical protein
MTEREPSRSESEPATDYPEVIRDNSMAKRLFDAGVEAYSLRRSLLEARDLMPKSIDSIMDFERGRESLVKKTLQAEFPDVDWAMEMLQESIKRPPDHPTLRSRQTPPRKV